MADNSLSDYFVPLFKAIAMCLLNFHNETLMAVLSLSSFLFLVKENRG